jgi:CheY-like chemotaxis protein
VESSVAAVGSMARQYDIQLIVEPCADDAGELQVLGDAMRLEQVCWNLLSNAIKFSPRGSQVRVRMGIDDTNVWVEVVDHGKGIESEHLPRVFDRLFQGTSPGRFRSSGLGLGLNIVRHVVELHGGTVQAQSDGPDKGAIFRFTLPHCEFADSAPQTPVAPGEPDEKEFPCLRGIKVLVVDGDTEARESISLLLGLCGAKTRAASSAAEGWTILQDWKPQVLLSDPDLQPENGQSLIEKIRTSSNGISRTPAIALCQRDCASGEGATFDRYLLKSIDPAKLASIVGRLCSKSAQL